MPLSDFKPQRREVKLSGDNSFFVEGLSLDSLAALLHTHLDDLQGMGEMFSASGDFDKQSIEKVVTIMLTRFPGLAANIIAVASGEPGTFEQAAKLPGPLQINALVAIGELTFTEVGGVKKFLEMVAHLLTATRTNREAIQQTLTPTSHP